MTEQRTLPYALIRDKDGELLFEASYAKHYAEGYCALFLQYPSSDTQIQLCRKLETRDTSYGYNLVRLVRRFTLDEATDIGYYVPLCEASSEEEATKIMQDNITAEIAFQSLMEENK
jgi:hypothetical protein